MSVRQAINQVKKSRRKSKTLSSKIKIIKYMSGVKVQGLKNHFINQMFNNSLPNQVKVRHNRFSKIKNKKKSRNYYLFQTKNNK